MYRDLLFIGFIATIFHTLPEQIFGIVWIELPNQTITLATLVWCIGVNLYLSILWYVIYRHTNDVIYQFVSACYIFAIVEMFVVWDKPWFRLFGVPMTSNTLIIFGFFFGYVDRKWKLLNSFNSTY